MDSLRLGETPLEISFVIAVSAERTGDFAVNSVLQGDAIAVGIMGFDGFGNADRNPALCPDPKGAAQQASHCCKGSHKTACADHDEPPRTRCSDDRCEIIYSSGVACQGGKPLRRRSGEAPLTEVKLRY